MWRPSSWSQILLPLVICTTCVDSGTSFVSPLSTWQSPHKVPQTVLGAAGKNPVLVSDLVAMCFFGSACLVGGATAQADIDILSHGAKVFRSNCAACHVGGQNLVAPQKTLQKDAIEQNIGLDVESVKNYVQDGMVHRGALMFGGKLSDKDFFDVASYVVDKAVAETW